MARRRSRLEQADAVEEVAGLLARDRFAVPRRPPASASAAHRAPRLAGASVRASAPREPQARDRRRTGHHLVAGPLDRVQRGAAARDERRDGDAGPPAQPADQRRPLVEQRARALRPRTRALRATRRRRRPPPVPRGRSRSAGGPPAAGRRAPRGGPRRRPGSARSAAARCRSSRRARSARASRRRSTASTSSPTGSAESAQ